MNRNTLGIIGLAMKAGKIAFGADSCVEQVRNKKAFLVIAASDISANTAKLLTDKTAYYSVRLVNADVTMGELGRAIGRKSAAAVAFTDENFVRAYDKSVDNANTERGM